MVPTVILSRLICVLRHIKLLSLTCKIDSFRSLFLKNGSHYSFVSIQLLLLNVKWVQWILFHFSQTILGKTRHSGSDFTMHQYLLTESISEIIRSKCSLINLLSSTDIFRKRNSVRQGISLRKMRLSNPCGCWNNFPSCRVDQHYPTCTRCLLRLYLRWPISTISLSCRSFWPRSTIRPRCQ